MLQSTVNFLGSTSTVWNSQYLKKIFRIPEDQLKILNNIPGWRSEVDSEQNRSSSITIINKDNQQTSSIALTPTSILSQKDLVANFSTSEKHSEDTNRKERFPLRKSSSLDSVNIHKTNFSLRTLKRSSSTSNINQKATEVQTSSFDAFGNRAILTEKSSLSNIEEVEEMQVDMEHRSSKTSQFSSSGVQCKMSQDLNLELDVFQTNVATALPSSSFSAGRESLKLLNASSPSSQTCEREQIDKLAQINLRKSKNDFLGDVGLLSKENLPEKSKIDVDDSYISQPVPCAQPLPESIHSEKGLVIDQKESIPTSHNITFSPISKSAGSPLDKSSFPPSGKRKRKSRTEKSKKHKVECAEQIKIEYSLNQIKNMIELVKILHKY